MKNHLIFALIMSATIGLSGCASMVVPKPGNVTLENALQSVGRGLVEMKKSQIEANGGKDFSTGLVASEAEVTFNISASGSQNGELHVELSPLPSIPVGAGGSVGTTYNSARGNQITIKFKSLVLSKTTTKDNTVTVEGITDPKLLEAIVTTLRKLEMPIFIQ